jgi:hypothetical protein
MRAASCDKNESVRIAAGIGPGDASVLTVLDREGKERLGFTESRDAEARAETGGNSPNP